VNSGLGFAAFRLGMFLLLVSGGLLLFLERGSAEQAITLFTFFLAVIFLAVIVVLVRLGQRKS
jgi:hypothetical protein